MARIVCKGRSVSARGVLTASLLLAAGLMSPAQAQTITRSPYDSFSRSARGLPWGPAPFMVNPSFNFPAREPSGPPSTISSDALRFPLSERTQRRLEKIMHLAEAGDHAAAIRALLEFRVKQPSAEPYVASLLGEEYLETDQREAAVESFESAARLMPHDPGAHSNLGLSLALVKKYDLAETELNKALELDKANEKARTILDALHVARRKAAAAAR